MTCVLAAFLWIQCFDSFCLFWRTWHINLCLKSLFSQLFSFGILIQSIKKSVATLITLTDFELRISRCILKKESDSCLVHPTWVITIGKLELQHQIQHQIFRFSSNSLLRGRENGFACCVRVAKNLLVEFRSNRYRCGFRRYVFASSKILVVMSRGNRERSWRI